MYNIQYFISGLGQVKVKTILGRALRRWTGQGAEHCGLVLNEHKISSNLNQKQSKNILFLYKLNFSNLYFENLFLCSNLNYFPTYEKTPFDLQKCPSNRRKMPIRPIQKVPIRHTRKMPIRPTKNAHRPTKNLPILRKIPIRPTKNTYIRHTNAPDLQNMAI